MKTLIGFIMMFVASILLLLSWFAYSFAGPRELLPLEKYADFMAIVLYVALFIYGYQVSRKGAK